jgi:hypothetical protein
MPAYIFVPELPTGMTVEKLVEHLRSNTPQLLHFNTSQYPADKKIPFQNYGGGHVSDCTIRHLRELCRKHNISVFENHRQPEEAATASARR